MTPFDLTIASIFRDACGYLPRYLAQVEQVLQTAGRTHLVWLEGDSTDGTYDRLAFVADTFRAEYDATVTLTRYNTGGPLWPSIDHAPRWQQLASCWNRNLLAVQPSRHVVFVESDLIWAPATLWSLIKNLHRADVLYGALFHAAGHFYDTHSFMSNGQHWTISPPFSPPGIESVDERFIAVESAGGMIVTTGGTVKHFCDGWSSGGCVLQFDPSLTKVVDMQARVLHP